MTMSLSTQTHANPYIINGLDEPLLNEHVLELSIGYNAFKLAGLIIFLESFLIELKLLLDLFGLLFYLQSLRLLH